MALSGSVLSRSPPQVHAQVAFHHVQHVPFAFLTQCSQTRAQPSPSAQRYLTSNVVENCADVEAANFIHGMSSAFSIGSATVRSRMSTNNIAVLRTYRTSRFSSSQRITSPSNRASFYKYASQHFTLRSGHRATEQSPLSFLGSTEP